MAEQNNSIKVAPGKAVTDHPDKLNSSHPAVTHPASKPHPIEVDDDPNPQDDFQFTETDGASSTQSVASSIINYKYENGRRYHAYREGEYVMPNDEQEQARLDLHHHLWRLMTGGTLFRAPVDPSTMRVLDLGTGTGIWAMDMADQYPNATIRGIDLSPIQPQWVPPNCRFEVDCFESSWHYSKPFDFIHARNLACSVRDFPSLYKSIMEHLKPGGWVEVADHAAEPFADDDTLKNAPHTVRWAELLDESSLKHGKRFNVAAHLEQWMIDAGFKNVKQEIFKVPVNPWPKDPKMKELGRYNMIHLLEAIDPWSLALFTRQLGWSNEEFQAFFAGVRREIQDRSIHMYAKYYFVYGQKPE